jgi:hypothetical protein
MQNAGADDLMTGDPASLLGVHRRMGERKGELSSERVPAASETDLGPAGPLVQAECPLCRQSIGLSRLLPVHNI